MRNDGLEPRELTALSVYELGALLNDIDGQTAAFSRVAVDAWRTIGEAESHLVMHPEDRSTVALVKSLRAKIKATEIQLRALRLRQSRIQTILRTMQ